MADNVIQKIESILFSSEYHKFMEALLDDMPNYSENQRNKLLNFAVLVYLTITIREKDETPAWSFLKKLQPLL